MECSTKQQRQQKSTYWMERAVNKLQETRKESTERQSREKINPNEKVTIWGVKMGFLPHYWGLQDVGTRGEMYVGTSDVIPNPYRHGTEKDTANKFASGSLFLRCHLP